MSDPSVRDLIASLRDEIAEAKETALRVERELHDKAISANRLLRLMEAMRGYFKDKHGACGDYTNDGDEKCLACFLERSTICLAGGG